MRCLPPMSARGEYRDDREQCQDLEWPTEVTEQSFVKRSKQCRSLRRAEPRASSEVIGESHVIGNVMQNEPSDFNKRLEIALSRSTALTLNLKGTPYSPESGIDILRDDSPENRCAAFCGSSACIVRMFECGLAAGPRFLYFEFR